MGNQGTTNWKLTTLFAVSLMLIAGLFSNAAIADGEGTITVEWAAGGGTALSSTFLLPVTRLAVQRNSFISMKRTRYRPLYRPCRPPYPLVVKKTSCGFSTG